MRGPEWGVGLVERGIGIYGGAGKHADRCGNVRARRLACGLGVRRARIAFSRPKVRVFARAGRESVRNDPGAIRFLKNFMVFFRARGNPTECG